MGSERRLRVTSYVHNKYVDGLKQWSVEVIAPDRSERFEDWVVMFTDSDPNRVGEYALMFLQDNPFFDFDYSEAAAIVYENYEYDDGSGRNPEWPAGIEVEIL